MEYIKRLIKGSWMKYLVFGLGFGIISEIFGLGLSPAIVGVLVVILLDNMN